ncbi:MAG: 3-keto-disaccharide hydrolase [Acidobacteriota bacterium]
MSTQTCTRRQLSAVFWAAAVIAGAAVLYAGGDMDKWKIHDMDRPVPPLADPGPAAQDAAARPPSDSIVLFGGQDLSQWEAERGGPAPWKVENGYMEVVSRTGSIVTRQGFGDCQLHIEWAAPLPAEGEGQHRGNSGVFLMNSYEVQVLNSHDNRTYADGQAAAVYGQHPPLVNASRPPGQWQTYDIVFHGPRFDESGKVTSPARVTVLHNGVLVQDNVELSGPTAHQQRPAYQAHADKLPIKLQDHGQPVRFRNIWIRPLE